MSLCCSSFLMCVFVLSFQLISSFLLAIASASSICDCSFVGNAWDFVALNYTTSDSLLPSSKLNAPLIYVASLHALDEPNFNSVSFGQPISFSCLQAIDDINANPLILPHHRLAGLLISTNSDYARTIHTTTMLCMNVPVPVIGQLIVSSARLTVSNSHGFFILTCFVWLH